MSRLSRDDWSQAALVVISERGVAGLAIEPLAAQLGTTKGSFYWHFSARDELVAAALELWEARSTTAVIERVEAAADTDPAASLRALFELAFDPTAMTGADVALLSHLNDERVRDAVERVTARRIDYICSLLRQTGVSPTAARRRALFAYSAFLGHVHLKRHTPDLVSAQMGSNQRYIDELLRILLA
jgi:AcrR family transcriptional regulator